MNKFLEMLKRYFKESQTHLMRLNSAYSKIKPIIPLNAKSIKNLSEDQIVFIDQYLYRFAKLQDVIGEKLFPSVLTFIGEDVSKLSFIDIFNRLEQLEIVQDYEKWVKLRLVRNELSHEYDDEPDANAEKLNRIINLKNDLEKYLDDVKKYLQRFKEFG